MTPRRTGRLGGRFQAALLGLDDARKVLGVCPKALRNSREKCAVSAKPVMFAISITESEPPDRR